MGQDKKMPSKKIRARRRKSTNSKCGSAAQVRHAHGPTAKSQKRQAIRLAGELKEALRREAATAQILKVIGRATFDLTTVLHTLVETAAELCEADKGTITRQKDGTFDCAESRGFSDEFMWRSSRC
jgi:hypothetical protein